FDYHVCSAGALGRPERAGRFQFPIARRKKNGEAAPESVSPAVATCEVLEVYELHRCCQLALEIARTRTGTGREAERGREHLLHELNPETKAVSNFAGCRSIAAVMFFRCIGRLRGLIWFGVIRQGSSGG
ncbi:MAG: hypothetical protein WD801_09620, partial [Gemmatimonadaceae bacterium]